MGGQVWLGVDPGRAGAMAIVSDGFADAWPTPMLDAKTYDLAAIATWLREWRHRIAGATVERLHALPPLFKGKGGAPQAGGSLANFGRGESLGWFWMLAALEIPTAGVSAQAWQRAMHAGVDGSDTKARSIAAAQKIFPGVSLLESERSRKFSDGLADAVLIAEYGRRSRKVFESR